MGKGREHQAYNRLCKRIQDCLHLTRLLRMGPDVHSRGYDELRPTGYFRSRTARRAHITTAFAFEFCRRPYLHPRYPLLNELYPRPKGCHLFMQ